MADSKKYYWLRLQHDFFSSMRIKKLLGIEEGRFVIIYMKMQLKSLKEGGLLTYKGIEDTFEKEIALDIDEDVGKVERAVKLLIEYGMIEKVGSKQYVLPYAQANIGSETESASRMRQLRARKQEEKPEKVEHGDDNVEQSANKVTGKTPEPPKEKPKKENVFQVFDRLADEIELQSAVRDKMTEWLKYKVERRESYKETGLKSLLKQVQKHTIQYGSEAVNDLIDKCMSSNWAGIIWERLEKTSVPTKQERLQNRVSEVDNW